MVSPYSNVVSPYSNVALTYSTVICLKDSDTNNGSDFKSSLIRVYTVCSNLSVQIFRIITVLLEPRHEKTCLRGTIKPHFSNLSHLMTKPTKWHVCPAKTQISLSICRVWSVFADRMKKAWVLSYPLNTKRRLGGCPGWSAQRRLWSYWADAQADLSLRWAHSHFVGFVMRWLILG